MARTLLYHLNRLQDILSLPRTSGANYPVASDPLHNDTILTEDIWEASKVVTGDLGRRGIMDVVSTTTAIVKGQNAYTLPKDICRLQAIEYFDGTYWRGPLVAIPYDDYVRLSAAKTEGTPEYYTHTQSDARQVYLTISDGITESSFRDTGPLTLKSAASLSVTSTGDQINKDDLVFNVTRDSGGLVEYLTMGTIKGNTEDNAEVTAVVIDKVNNLITLSVSASWFSNSFSLFKVGDILLQESSKAWVVITGVVSTATNEIELTFDGTIRGNDFLDFTVSGGVNHKLLNKLIIGTPDRLVVQSDNAFILDANQGMSGATTDVVSTYTASASNPAIVFTHTTSLGTYNLEITNDEADVDLSAYASAGYTLVISTANETYTGYIQAVTVDESGNYDESTLSLTSTPTATAGSVTSLHVAHQATITDPITSVSITKPPLFVGDVIQLESQFATLDTIQVYPYPNKDDTLGTEGIRMTYIPYPVKPVKPDQVIELPDAFNDAILAKAHEYATRREINRTEPYEESIRRATSISRPVANTSLMRNQRNRFGRVVNFVIPS